MAAFGPIAPFYDELMRTVPYRMWTGYYLLLLAQQGIKPRTMLDVCCGTGIMAEMLTREGFTVAGFDISAPMVEMAKRKAARKKLVIRYECQDAAQFAMGTTFDAAFSFFDSLNYITEPAQLAQAIQRVADHLEPGGSFVFDLNTAYAFEAKLFDQHQLGLKAKVRYDWKGHWDPATRLIRVDMDFWRGEESFHEEHWQRAHSDLEVREMLAQAGFDEVRCYHSYTLDRPRKTSDRVHYSAIRL